MNTLVWVIAIFVTVILATIGSIRRIREGHEALVERKGRYHRRLTAGLNFGVLPSDDVVVAEASLKEQVLGIQFSEVATKDDFRIRVKISIFWKILELERAWYAVEDVESVLKHLVSSAVRIQLGKLTLQEINSAGPQLKRYYFKDLDKKTKQWGVTVTRLYVLDIEIKSDPSDITLTFQSGVQWRALAHSFKVIASDGVELTVKSIYQRSDGVIVIRVKVLPEEFKTEVENLIKYEYEIAFNALKQQYHHELRKKDIEIEGYQRRNANLTKIIKLVNTQPNIAQTVKKSKSEAQDMNTNRYINTEGGDYYESINTSGGDYIQGDYINMSQDLTQAATQIQSLIEQLQKNGVTVDVAQEQVAKDMGTQAQNNLTMKNKLLRWGQSLGDATVTDVVKGVVKLAIRSAGIPLP